MPTTRSSAKKKKPSVSKSPHVEVTETPSSRYQTRSQNRSQCDLEMERSPEGLKFPFFDEQNTSASQNYDLFLSPGMQKSNQQQPAMDSSCWETELSPIALNRGSDVSQKVLDVTVMDIYNSPPPTTSLSKNEPISIEQVNVDEGKRKASNLSPTHPSQETNVGGDHSDHGSKMLIEDLSSARKQVGQTSHEFIERIRNAAHRRKVAMTRSRDSLVAKEMEQLRSNAERNKPPASNSSSSQEKAGVELSDKDIHSTNADASKNVFKARPLPPTTGALGTGGMDGVPKVDKKPTTTPFSPLLGSRRQQKPKIKALEAPKKSELVVKPARTQVVRPPVPITKKEKDLLVRPFKARAIPPAVRSAGSSGQFGVPKIEKRPLTVAMSPQLGPRRRTKSADARPVSSAIKVNVTQPHESMTPKIPVSFRVTRARTKSIEISSISIPSESPTLFGLNLITTPKTGQNENDENRTPQFNQQIKPFEPHSTRRAKKRAEFDTRRKSMFEIRSEREMEDRENEIRKMNRELNLLRPQL